MERETLNAYKEIGINMLKTTIPPTNAKTDNSIEVHLLDLDNGYRIEYWDNDFCVQNLDNYVDDRENLYIITYTENGQSIYDGVSSSVFPSVLKLYQSASKKTTKKLGAWHFIITYIWLPLIILLFILSIFGNIISCVTESVMVYLPYLLSNIIILICSSLACVSLITQNQKAYFLIHACCISLIYGYVIEYIANIITHTNIIQCIPLGLLTIIIISVCIHKYYKKRQHCLDNSRMGSIFRNCENFLCTIIAVVNWCCCGLVYCYSVYHMFKDSIGYGLFGVFVPGISQFVFLFNTGFSSVYAFVLYFTCATFILHVVFGIFTEQ